MHGRRLNDGEKSIRNAFFEGIDFCLEEHEYCWDEIEALFSAIRDGNEDDIAEAAINLRMAIVEHDNSRSFDDNYGDEYPRCTNDWEE